MSSFARSSKPGRGSGRRRLSGRLAFAIGCAAILGACSTSAPLRTAAHQPVGAAAGCTTASASIAFDFPGASASRCVIEGDRAFSVLVSPEHGPPINPSPWYAFRYSSDAPDLTVTLRYLEARHRYAPKLIQSGVMTSLEPSVLGDGKAARLTLPQGEGQVVAQPLWTGDHYRNFNTRLAATQGVIRFEVGRSHDGRLIEGLRMGDPAAPRLIVLLGRQHPPEVTGAYAMDAFTEEMAAIFASDPALARQYQIVAFPLLNPDGVERGHWRANLGGTDLNRDWGPFKQPETRAVAAWLDQLPAGVKPALMLDFHSTGRNLAYVQGDEASAAQARFLAAWLGGQENAVDGYAFTLEPRNANPGSGTAKNWFHARYAIPAYTWEVGDGTTQADAARAARYFARRLPAAMRALTEE